MNVRAMNSENAPAPAGGYAQAVEITNSKRLVFVSGQIPVDVDGQAPTGFGDQCRLAWTNVAAQLSAAGMTFENLVKVTVFLSSGAYALENRAIRAEVLGSHTPAMTVIITGIFDESWLLEIEAVAAD